MVGELDGAGPQGVLKVAQVVLTRLMQTQIWLFGEWVLHRNMAPTRRLCGRKVQHMDNSSYPSGPRPAATQLSFSLYVPLAP